MKTYGGLDVQTNVLTSALDKAKRSASHSGRFTPSEMPPPPGTHWTGGWVVTQNRSGRREDKKPDLIGT
jgi:hypothetical protein